ncbi:hypothetical protein BGZ65_004861, partial [Modicella reniformis]
AALATDASDRLQKVAHYLQNIQLPPAKIPVGYNFALVICGLTIKGMTLEEEGRIPDAIVSYDNVSVLVQANLNERTDELNNWAEHALYRASMLKLRQGDQLAAIRSFRTYHNLAVQWPSNFRLQRRTTIYRYFAGALSNSLMSHGANGNGASAVADDQAQFYPDSLRGELVQVHAYWEDALYAVCSFPTADKKNWHVLVMIEQIVEDWKVIGPGNNADKRVLVETIYRASQKTFESPRILRFLFFALVDFGQYDEAVLALKAYLELAEINSKVKAAGDNDEVLSHEQRIKQDIESERDIATVMVEGSRLYGKELGKPIESFDCAERAVAKIQKNLQNEDAQELLYNAYNYQGIAHALLASQAHEPEKRPALYAKAVEAYQKAIEVCPEAFEAHYYLALQFSETREVPKAIAAVKDSLNLNSAHIPSWHLLVLLLSSQKEYEPALNVCSVGLKESEWDLPSTDGFSASQLDGEDYLALRITQAALHDQIHGPESALESQEALFIIYTKIFGPEPSSLGDSLYDIQNIRRRDQSDIEQGSTIVGRPRAGSILSVRSRSGVSDLGQSIGGSNSSTLDIPKQNYASSVTSIGSSGSKWRNKPIPPAATAAAAAAAAGTSVGKSLQNIPATVQRSTGRDVLRTARANKVLVTLWLMSASVFRRLDRMEEALKAIEEAERVDASNPEVWYQLGLLYAAQGDPDTASVSFCKALALAPHHTACLTRVGRAYLEAGSLEMAESMLETTTKSEGWSSAEAWYYLGKVFEASDRLSRAKECFWYALDLEQSRPIRDFADALPRFLV